MARTRKMRAEVVVVEMIEIQGVQNMSNSAAAATQILPAPVRKLRMVISFRLKKIVEKCTKLAEHSRAKLF